MNKQEIEHKLEQARKDERSIDDNIIKLLEQLAEAEKPKLRHGDFGLEEVGESSYPRLVTNPASVTGLSLSNQYGEIPPGNKITTIFGNIFDLMNDEGKDLEEFQLYGIRVRITNQGSINIGGQILAKQYHYDFWRKFGQMLMYLKRKQS